MKNKEDQRQLILQAAREITSQEGLEKLSIRKIAGKIGYSPGNIYYYFKDRDAIVNTLLSHIYKEMTASLNRAFHHETPEEAFSAMFYAYLENARQHPEEFKSIMLNSSDKVLTHTALFSVDAPRDRPAFQMLCQIIQRMNPHIPETRLLDCASLVWTATFGMILRILVEKRVPQSIIDGFANTMKQVILSFS